VSKRHFIFFLTQKVITMANYNASSLVALAKEAEEAKAKQAETKEVCENTPEPKKCVKRMIEAWSDCD